MATDSITATASPDRLTGQMVMDYIVREAPAMGLPANYALAIANIESSLDPNNLDAYDAYQTNSIGAHGPMQVIPTTYDRHVQSGKVDKNDPFSYVRAGLIELKRTVDHNPGNYAAATAQYQGDSHFRDQSGWQSVTSEKVPAVLAKAKEYETLLGQRQTPNSFGSDGFGTGMSVTSGDIASGAFDLNTTLGKITGSLQNAQNYKQGVSALGNTIIEQSLGFGQDAAKAIDRGSKVTEVLAREQLKTERNNAAATAAVGLNQDFVGNLISKLGPDLAKRTAEISEANKRYDDAREISFLKDPIGAIVARVGTMHLVDDVKALQDSVDMDVENLSNLQGLASNQVALNAAAKVTVTDETINLTRQQDAILAAQEVRKAAIGAATTGIDVASKLHTADNESLSLVIEGNKLIASNTQRLLQQEQVQLLNTSRQYTEEQKKAADAADRASIESINDLGAKLGLSASGTNLVNSIDDINRLPKATRTVLSSMTLNRSYAETPGEAVNTAGSFYKSMTPGEQIEYQQAAGVLNTVVSANMTRVARENALSPGSAKVDNVTMFQVGGDSIINTYTAMHRDVTKIPTDVKYNSYAAKDVKSVLQADFNLKGTLATDKAGKLVLSSAQVNPNMTDQQIVGTLYEAVKNKQISREEAAIWGSKYYQSAIRLNNAMSQFTKLMLPEQTGYNASIKTNPEAWRNFSFVPDLTAPVDLTSTAALEHLLILMGSKDALKDKTGIPALSLPSSAEQNAQIQAR